MKELIPRLLSLPVVLCCAMCATAPKEKTPVKEPIKNPLTCELLFRFPILEREKISNIVLGADHDPEDRDLFDCLSYDGLSFPHCYDGHDGFDYSLYGGFDSMDNGSASVVAAAGGLIIEVEDGHYDRCHFDLNTLSADCDGHPMIANLVVIEHPPGPVSYYAHLMKDSIVVFEGQWVEQGDFLGFIGSSGLSSTPHLHFETRDANNIPFDPYSGPYSQDKSWWCIQGDTNELPGECL